MYNTKNFEKKINSTKPQKRSYIKNLKKNLALKNLKKRATEGRINPLYSSLWHHEQNGRVAELIYEGLHNKNRLAIQPIWLI